MKKKEIPQDLIEKSIWVNFKILERNGKKTKIPFQINGDYAKSNDKTTWNTIYEVGNNISKFDGIGFCFVDDICGIDIDNCIDEKGEYTEIAKDIMTIMQGTYIEKSPSGKGLHIIFRANNIIDKENYYINNSKIGVEIYGVPSSKFFTFTGKYLYTVEKLPDLTNEIKKIQEKYMKKEKSININEKIIKEALEKDKKFYELWNKQATGSGGTESEDDMSLCSKLAYYLKNNYTEIKNYFLKSPYFESKDDDHRNKCLLRDDYLRTTIEKVIGNTLNSSTQQNTNKIEPLSTISANDLQKKDIPQLKCIVENLIYEGLTILVSPPKYGKSWFSLDLCLSVASGEKFLIFNTNKHTCLYLALEDSYRRLQDRMNKLLIDKEAPANFYFATDSYKIDNGLLEQLQIELEKNPSLTLIVIDTLQKVRSITQGNTNVYASDYEEISKLKSFADLHHISIVIVHHTKKDENQNDPYSNISGSNGIAGSVDTMLIMSKDKRGEKNTKFSITGRDILENELIIIRNLDTQKWEVTGTVDEMELNKIRSEYNNSLIIQTIKKLLDEDYYIQMTCSQLKEKIEEKFNISYDKAPNTISKEIKKWTNLLNEDNINVELPSKNGGKKGRNYIFYKNNE